MKGLPRATVVIACHSEARWASLVASIASVRDQSHVADIVVAVDHNPLLADRLRTEAPDLHVVENSSPARGASATRNAGAAAVATEVTAFLDDDEIAASSWLAELLAPFADRAVVGTGGRYRPAWQAAKPRWFPDEFAWAVGGSYTGMPTTTARVRNVWSGNMAVRTEAFQSVAGFREGFGKVAGRSRPEDTDLCIRVAHVSGGHWIYVPDAIIDHDVPRDRSTFAFFLRRSFAEGRGKIEMRQLLDSEAVLDAESDYLRRTIPLGLRRHFRGGAVGWLRGFALVAGVGAAGAGAATAVLAAGMRRPSAAIDAVVAPPDPASVVVLAEETAA